VVEAADGDWPEGRDDQVQTTTKLLKNRTK
jgi:hypothetical protein